MDYIEDVLNSIIENKENIFTAKLGLIESYSNGYANVQPLPSDRNGLILQVPVVNFKSKNFYINLPYQNGDLVVILFISNDIDNILSGTDSVGTELGTAKDCVVVGGIGNINSQLPTTNDFKNLDLNNLFLAKLEDNSAITSVELSDSQININAPTVNINGGKINLSGDVVSIASKSEGNTWG